MSRQPGALVGIPQGLRRCFLYGGPEDGSIWGVADEQEVVHVSEAQPRIPGVRAKGARIGVYLRTSLLSFEWQGWL